MLYDMYFDDAYLCNVTLFNYSYNINAPLWHWHYLKIDLQYTSFTCCRQQMNEDDLSLEENGWL